jgi:Fe(3+) dicitrate transport protein
MSPLIRVCSLSLVVAALLPTNTLAQASAGRPSRPDSATIRPHRDSITRLPGLTIVGSADDRTRIPGSVSTLDRATLSRARVFTTNEALRKISGIVVRDEEGLGLRPNIGIRGLNPTRSTKVLLLEDGVPVSLAPYGDNAAYYHPPIGRMERVEVLKGAGQILYGPQTVGGVINYITPGLPARSATTLRLAGGSNEFGSAYARVAAVQGEGGTVVDIARLRSLGARENIASDVSDATVKFFLPVAPSQRLVAKANLFREGSQVTYSGLREDEWAADPRQNPFRNDVFDIQRLGGSLAHEWTDGRRRLVTTLYGHNIQRDWWRQSSNSAQRPNDAADPACAGLANLEAGCGNEGRLRHYQIAGIEPRYSQPLLLGALAGSLDAGLRLHREVQTRLQVNGAAHDSRSVGPSTNPGSGVLEDNRRTTDALAGYAQVRLGTLRWTVTPGLRVEHIEIARTNRRPLAGAPSGVSGATSLTEIIPGIGATFAARDGLTLFAGVHRGFAPPRNEDIISNTTGGVIELDPERSWNTEVGARWSLGAGWQLEATAFRLAFENQIIPASVAGGVGATLTSAGRTLHQGAELDLRGELPALAGLTPFVQLATTWVPVARFEGERFAYIGTGGADVVGKVYAEQDGGATRTRLRVTGNRLPYAPEVTVTATLGMQHRAGFDVSAEAVHLGRQFGDAANTFVLVPDGQQGPLAANTIWNLSANWTSAPLGVTVFATVKNVFDELVLVDRTRGLLPGMPRLVQLGVERSF